jgi:hypothetical protein
LIPRMRLRHVGHDSAAQNGFPLYGLRAPSGIRSFELRYRITPEGSEAFRAYLRNLRLILDAAQDTDATAETPRDSLRAL